MYHRLLKKEVYPSELLFEALWETKEQDSSNIFIINQVTILKTNSYLNGKVRRMKLSFSSKQFAGR